MSSSTSHGIPLGIPFALALLIQTLIESGEPEAAERELRNSGLGPEIPPTITGNFLLEARSRLHVALGKEREGLEDMLEFGRRDELWGAANPLASRWRSRAALAIAAMGDAERARRMAEEDLERAGRWGAASGLGVALRATALVQADRRPSIGYARPSEVLERSPARLEHARALTDLGAALRRANRRTDPLR